MYDVESGCGTVRTGNTCWVFLLSGVYVLASHCTFHLMGFELPIVCFLIVSVWVYSCGAYKEPTQHAVKTQAERRQNAPKLPQSSVVSKWGLFFVVIGAFSMAPVVLHFPHKSNGFQSGFSIASHFWTLPDTFCENAIRLPWGFLNKTQKFVKVKLT